MTRFLFTCTVLLLAWTTGGHAEIIVFSGSTTVQSRILEPLADDIRRVTGIELRVEGIGSGNGLKRLMAGEVPAAIISSPLASFTKSLGLDEGAFIQHDLAEDIIVPIVNHTNPLSQLTWDQLRDLYAGTVKNWKEIGGSDRKVEVITSHPESATREVVWELVMGKRVDYARGAKIVYATRKEMVLVAAAPGGIGAVSEGFVRQYFEDVRGENEPAEIKIIATPRISRPLAVITKGAPSPAVEKVLAYLRSDDARRKFR